MKALNKLIQLHLNQSTRDAWIKKQLLGLKPELKILDAGAGQQKYKRWCKHLKYYSQDFEELIYNPVNYFYYDGYKFLTLQNVKKMKKKRGETKDKKDIYLINTIIKKQPWPKRIYKKVILTLTISPSIIIRFIGVHIPKPLSFRRQIIINCWEAIQLQEEALSPPGSIQPLLTAQAQKLLSMSPIRMALWVTKAL